MEDINTWDWTLTRYNRYAVLWFLGIVHLSYIALAISQPQLCIELDKRGSVLCKQQQCQTVPGQAKMHINCFLAMF